MNSKKVNHIFRNILGLATLLLLPSCSSFLEESSQDTDYVRTWDDLNELLIGSCYMPVYNTTYYDRSSSNYGMMLHLVTDELEDMKSYSAGEVSSYESHYYLFGYYTWQQRSGQNETYTDFYAENYEWTKVYNEINVANNVLDNIKDVPQITDAEKQGVLKVSGEAHFLRGYYYFWLVNLYGNAYNSATASTDPGVPIKTTAEVEDKVFGRNTVAEVYEQVLSDLHAAETELSQLTTEKKSIYRADSTAVQLLLSRVYLYMQNWQKAAEYAQKVIDKHPSLQNLNTNKTKFMLKTNTENIFSMGGDDVPGLLNNGYRSMKVSDVTYSNYSSNDMRKNLWFWSYGDFHGLTMREEGTYNDAVPTTNQRYYSVMYCNGLTNAQSQVSSVFWLRSAEAYLNLAEAQAYMGNDGEARNAILTLMNCRYIPNSSELNIADKSGGDLIETIRNERRKEFVLQGQRWFDLRRYRVCDVHPQKTTITHDYMYFTDHTSSVPTECHRFVLNEDDKSWTLPMPNEVIEYNTGMETNHNEWRSYTIVTE